MRNSIPKVAYHPDPRRLNPCVLDLVTSGAAMIVPLAGIDVLAFQIALMDTGTWPAGAVLTVQLGNDGINFSAVPAAAVTYNTAVTQEALNVRGVEWAKIFVSTVAGATSRVQITATGEGDG